MADQLDAVKLAKLFEKIIPSHIRISLSEESSYYYFEFPNSEYNLYLNEIDSYHCKPVADTLIKLGYRVKEVEVELGGGITLILHQGQGVSIKWLSG